MTAVRHQLKTLTMTIASTTSALFYELVTFSVVTQQQTGIEITNQAQKSGHVRT